MNHNFSFLISVISLITITNCKVAPSNDQRLDKTLREIESEKQIIVEAQIVKTNAEVEAKIKEIETQAEKEAQKIAEAEATIAEAIREEKQKISNSTEVEIQITKEELQKPNDKIVETKKQIIEMTQNLKQLIIAKLKLKAQATETILKIHTDSNWPEPNDHFGMTSKSNPNKDTRIFDVVNREYKHSHQFKTYLLNDEQSASDRKKIYLIFKYNKTKIQKYGEIFNHLIRANLNNNAKDIVNAIIDYAEIYFESALNRLNAKQNYLNSLTLETLNKLDKEFDNLEAEKQIFENYLTMLFDDYHNNQHNIKYGNDQDIINYMHNKEYEQKFYNSIKIMLNTNEKINKYLDTQYIN
ncbi:hypothetical protein bcCo53_001126 (plasmid) [Borrelia coriaceae]|uniref:CRASP family complement regulator-acquiring lipoprotein n=1 Tax=Borrelia coriaceae TaxID=144 RepID=UPI00046C98CB|nr:CRASP family complement regulator-acquiring lipoprotein [Borrelia coriaceae]UPA16958.1 hypothetical protein bcCo53_001126 [Borrelia coriaceae]